MSDDLEQEIAELKKLMLEHQKNDNSFHDSVKPLAVPNIVESSSKYIKWVQSMVALVLVIAGLGVNWGITTSKIAGLEARLDETKKNINAERTLIQSEVKKLQEEVVSLRLSDAAKDQNLLFIKAQLSEIKDDVKKLVRKK